MKAGPVSVPSPHFQMSQATFVVGALGIGWVLWLAAQNKLQTYWTLLIGGGASSSSSAASSSAVPQTTTPAPAGSGTSAPAGQAPFTGGLL